MTQVAKQLPGDDRLPLYERLVEVLKAAIGEGKWRPGDRLPSENDLAEQYAVAPGTARQAVSKLVGEGLLDRRHGAGTFVRKPTFDSSLFRFFRFHTDDGEHRIPESRILSRTIMPAPSAVAAMLRLPAHAPVVSMSRLRLFDGVPVMAEEIWLDSAPFEGLVDMDEVAIGPLLYPIYDSHFGKIVARAQESLTVEAVDKTRARLLRIAPGAPVIVIDRLALGFDGVPIEWRRSRGRADRFKYHIEIN